MEKMMNVVIALGFVAGLVSGNIAAAQQTGTDAPANGKSFVLELNGAKDNENGCRLTYVAFNGTGMALDKTAYEVVVFDKDGGVSQFLILEFGKLPARKTKVVQFDLKGNKCANISRLLINDVSECEAGGKTVAVCLDFLITKSRTEIGFGI